MFDLDNATIFNAVSLPGDASHTVLLKSHYANNNAHSFACVLLFPKSTKVSFGVPGFALSLNKAMLRQILILRRFVRYFFVQGKLHKKVS